MDNLNIDNFSKAESNQLSFLTKSVIPKLHFILHSRGISKNDAQDIIQDALTDLLTRIIRRPDRYTDLVDAQGNIINFQAWATKLTLNRVYLFLKRKGRNMDVENVYEEDQTDVDLSYIDNMNLEKIELDNILKQIDPGAQSILKLRVSGFTYFEIAKKLQISEASVKHRMNKAASVIKSLIGDKK